jgi:glycosyltransferase involved in cell wall biosynthesis
LEKILFILKLPPPVHGSTLMNLNVLNSTLVKEKFDASYFSLSISKEMTEVGKISWHKLKKTVGDYFNLFSVLRKIRPSLVYFAVSPVGFALFKDFIFFSIIKIYRVPVVFHHHGKGVKAKGESSRFYRFIYTRMFKNSDHICLSKEGVSDLSPYLSREANIVPNGVTDKAGKIEAPKKIKPTCRILYLSNFIINKGILDLIDACRLLKEENLDFEVSLVGKAYDISENEIRSRISGLGLDQFVKVIGPKYDEEKYRIFRESDLFVFPTKYARESFPLVILEAMQFGLPVISTYEGGIPGIIDNDVQGYLVNKNDIPTLADKMGHLIKNPHIMEAMGKRAREKYESRYTLEKFENGVVQAIYSTLSNNSKNKNIADVLSKENSILL